MTIEDRLGQIAASIDRLTAHVQVLAERLTVATPVLAGLNELESSIIEGLGEQTLPGAEIARRAGYPNNDTFRTALAGLRRRGVLGHNRHGYFVANQTARTPGER